MNFFVTVVALSILMTVIPVMAADERKSAPEQPVQRTVRLKPAVVIGPPVRREAVLSDHNRNLLRFYLRQTDLILNREQELASLGHVIRATERHHGIGQGETVLIHLSEPVPVGTTLNAFRPGPHLTDPVSRETLGVLVYRLGVLRVLQATGSQSLAEVVESVRAIHPGDRLVREQTVHMGFQMQSATATPMAGHVVRIRDNLEVAGANQVIAVSLGRQQRAVQGLILPIFRDGEQLTDPITQKLVAMPPSIIAHATLFHIGEKASFALLSGTLQPVRRGDRISSH